MRLVSEREPDGATGKRIGEVSAPSESLLENLLDPSDRKWTAVVRQPTDLLNSASILQEHAAVA
jgi:hypothetical protein